MIGNLLSIFRAPRLADRASDWDRTRWAETHPAPLAGAGKHGGAGGGLGGKFARQARTLWRHIAER